MAWVLKLVHHNMFEIVTISFMIAGHMKFSVDQLFSRVAQSFNHSDIFITEELAGIVEPYAIVVIDSGDIVTQWRAALDTCTKMPGKRGLHDFMFAKNPSNGDAMVRVCELCYNGPLKDSTIKVASGI